MTDSVRLPRIIQGGMGVGVSNWRLAPRGRFDRAREPVGDTDVA